MRILSNPTAVTRVVLGSILLLACALRLATIPDRGYDYDQIHTVMYASLPLVELVASVEKLDPHPPLYYLLLHFWMSVGVQEWWVRLSSVFLSLLTLLAIYQFTRRHFGLRAASSAALFFGVAPFSVFYAQQVRMYALMMLLAMTVMYLAEKFLTEGKTWAAVLLVPVLAVCAHAHGMGILLVASFSTLAAFRCLAEPAGRRTILWGSIGVVGVALLLSFPALRHGYGVTVRHAQVPDVGGIIQGLFVYFFGMYRAPAVMEWMLVVPMMGLLVFGAISDRRARNMLVSFFVIPLLVVLLASLFARPVWLARTFAFSLPIVCIVLGVAITRMVPEKISRAPLRRVVPIVGLVSLVLLASTMYQQGHPHHNMNFKRASEVLKAEGKGIERVYVPEERIFWGLGWYYLGVGRVHPLFPDSAYVSDRGPLLIVGRYPAPGDVSGRFWLVTRESAVLPAWCARAVVEERVFERLAVRECVSSPAPGLR